MNEAEKIMAATPAPAPAPKSKPAAKPAAKPTETFEAFSMPNIEMPEAFRDMAEKSVKQAKDGYEKMRTAAEEATDMMEDQFETTRTGLVAINVKAISAAKATADATFKFATDVMSAKSISDVIAMQSAFAREQFEIASANAKEIQELVAKFASEVSEPAKAPMKRP
ncbi:Phasin protein [Methylobrevis pamukkalensis]|uniref:Phasin protein n=2 Tax=Methylobrevis pamukkalensis TaxID=1439726 RepID=A0A1E3H5C5_9HYPH|nr:Phasin protein [Methylobrevis pamukkalensis]